MNRINIALFFATLMVIGVCAEPRKLLTSKNVETGEHQRILAELEEVHQLRERMLQEAAMYTGAGMGAPAPGPAGGSGVSDEYGDEDDTDENGFDQTDAFNANN